MVRGANVISKYLQKYKGKFKHKKKTKKITNTNSSYVLWNDNGKEVKTFIKSKELFIKKFPERKNLIIDTSKKPQKEIKPQDNLYNERLIEQQKVLKDFKARYTKLKACNSRISMLREYAEKIDYLPDKQDLDLQRKLHEANKGINNRNKKRWLITCKACKKETANHRHHIILLKHGGINKKNNIIELCETCHKLIHPWLK